MSKELDSATVRILQVEYKRLLEIELFFDCLRDAGVDNWEGYAEAMEDFNELLLK